MPLLGPLELLVHLVSANESCFFYSPISRWLLKTGNNLSLVLLTGLASAVGVSKTTASLIPPIKRHQKAGEEGLAVFGFSSFSILTSHVQKYSINPEYLWSMKGCIVSTSLKPYWKLLHPQGVINLNLWIQHIVRIQTDPVCSWYTF